MKLRNKKTGEIVEPFGIICVNGRTFVQFDDGEGTFKFEAHSLAEFNEEWEDYEEPKGIQDIYVPPLSPKECVIDFDTREEAEKAVEKLKAWKRLKDNGVKIVDYDYYGGTNRKGEFSGEVKVTIDVPQDIDKYLFKLLFGGEE